MDYALKFNSEEDADTVLFTRTPTVTPSPEGDVVEYFVKQNYDNMDVIGVIYREDEDGNMAPLDGWHVNIRTTQATPDLEPYQVFPQNPVRVWF